MNTKQTFISILITILVFTSLSSVAQKPKKMKELGIKSKTEWQYTYENGVESKYIEYQATYNSKGKISEEKWFDEKGNTVKHFSYKYNQDGNEIEKVTYNSRNEVVQKEETSYENGLKVEKKVFDSQDKLKSKKVFEYKN
ncbi:MAG TPA: hypothetical protein P5349_01630 [Tenuifilaceae bacterium]|nr:hypothetical protein [Tenuifilaceae bacterium]